MEMLAAVGSVFVLAYSVALIRRVIVVVPVLQHMSKLEKDMEERDKVSAMLYLVFISPAFSFEEVYHCGLVAFMLPHTEADIHDLAEMLVELFSRIERGGGDGPTI